MTAKCLIEALTRVQARDFPRAFELIEKAEELAPGYYEVHRVKGWAHTHHGNVPAAQEAYVAAIEFEPRSAPLRFWYGGFLLRFRNDTVAASEQLRIAAALDPTAVPVQSELGRTLMYSEKYEEAEQIF